MAKFKVTAPAAGYEGMVGYVRFIDGAAVIDEDRNPAELAYCRAAGYAVEPADAEPKVAQNGPEAAESGPEGGEQPFDPAEHNADEVLAYLGEVDADEATRVLDAEADGKNRKGITGQRDAILDSKKEEK